MSEASSTYLGKRYDAFVTREYQPGGEEAPRKDWTKVGVAFPHRSGKGFTLKIAPQIALSGDVVILEHEESTATS